MHHVVEPPKPGSLRGSTLSRRSLLEASGGAGLVAATVAWRSPAAAADPPPGDPSARKVAASRLRRAAAQAYLDEPSPLQRSNGDEARYADKRASFAKTLPHNEAGEVDCEAFAACVGALSSSDPDRFETIPRDRRAEVELNNPQATYAFDLVGPDSGATLLEPAPAFSSALMASEMAELYWLSFDTGCGFPCVRNRSAGCRSRRRLERVRRPTHLGERRKAHAGDGVPRQYAGRS